MNKELSKEEFKNLLKRYEEAYYSGESLISDEEYDALKDKYTSLYGEYEHIPNEGDTSFKKVKHLYPLLSLDKVQISDKEEIRKRLNKLWPVVIQPKFDGLSIEIQPDMKFITRGNGEIGDDVTNQCLQISNIKTIEPVFDKGAGSLRAEIIMTHNSFKDLNIERETQGLKLFDNCRNAAAGMLRNKDLNKVKGLTIMIYEDLSSIKRQTNIIEDLISYIGKDKLSKLEDNIRITPIFKPDNIDAAIELLEKLEEFREEIDYDIDGWVVKSDIENSIEVHGGYTGHHPKNAFAVKGEAKGAWTKLKSITWQVGKENITPVAELEPVKIDGSTISRCTLHNISVMEALGLNKITSNTLVKVIKANDVIPRIIEVKYIEDNESLINTIQHPKSCPICNSLTAIKESDSDSKILVCLNPDCSAKLQAKAELMASREALDITGLSEGTIAKILDTYDVSSHEEILLISKEEILNLEGFAEKSSQKLYDSIQKAIKKQTLDKVLFAAAIPLIGKSTAKDICTTYSFKELNEILNKTEEEAIKELNRIKGIGKETASSLIANKDKFIAMFNSIKEVTDINIKNKTNTTQKSFCITGQREPFKTIIEQAGHKVTGSVSKKTTALIAADGDLTTTKAIKAKELNIPIIHTEKNLKEFL